MAQRCGLVTQQIIDLGAFLTTLRVDWRLVSVLAESITGYSRRGADEQGIRRKNTKCRRGA